MDIESLKRIKPLCLTKTDSTKLMDTNIMVSALIDGGIDCLFYLSNGKTLLYEKSGNIEKKLELKVTKVSGITIFDVSYVPELKSVFIHDCFYLYGRCMLSEKFDTRYRAILEFLEYYKKGIVKGYKVDVNKIFSFTHLLNDDTLRIRAAKLFELPDRFVGGLCFKNVCFQYFGNYNVYSFGHYVLPDKYYINLKINKNELYVYDTTKRKEKVFELFQPGFYASSVLPFRYRDTMYDDFDDFAETQGTLLLKELDGLVCSFYFDAKNPYHTSLVLNVDEKDIYADTVSRMISDELSALYTYERYVDRLDISNLNYKPRNPPPSGTGVPSVIDVIRSMAGLSHLEQTVPNWVPESKELYYKDVIVDKVIPTNQFEKLHLDVIDMTYSHIQEFDLYFYYKYKNNIQTILDAGELVYKYNLLFVSSDEIVVYEEDRPVFNHTVNSFKFKKGSKGPEPCDTAALKILRKSDFNLKTRRVPKEFEKFEKNQNRKGNFDFELILARWNKYILLREVSIYTPYINRSFRTYCYAKTTYNRKGKASSYRQYKQITKTFKKDFIHWTLVIEFIDKLNKRYLSNTTCKILITRKKDQKDEKEDVNNELNNIIFNILTYIF